VKLIVYEFDLIPDINGVGWIGLGQQNGPMSNSGLTAVREIPGSNLHRRQFLCLSGRPLRYAVWTRTAHLL